MLWGAIRTLAVDRKEGATGVKRARNRLSYQGAGKEERNPQNIWL